MQRSILWIIRSCSSDYKPNSEYLELCSTGSVRIYRSGRSQRVSIDGSISNKHYLDCGVPQGSCLGPLLFTIYTSKLFDIIAKHLPRAHSFAGDTQLYVSFSPKEEDGQSSAIIAMERCITDGNSS